MKNKIFTTYKSCLLISSLELATIVYKINE